MGKIFLEKHFLHSAKKDSENFKDDDTLYRLLQDDESNALNADVSSDCEPRPGIYILIKLLRVILGFHIFERGSNRYTVIEVSKMFAVCDGLIANTCNFE